MKKLCLAALVAVTVSGCTSLRGNGLQLYFLRGVNLTIIHTCTNRALVYQGQELLADMSGVAPQTVPVVPRIGGHYVSVIVQSLDNNGQVVSNHTQAIYIADTWDQEPAWYIGDEGGGVARYRSSCRR
jgi:hypothetical protein